MSPRGLGYRFAPVGRGKPRSDEGEAQDGSKLSKVDVVADNVQFLDG